MYSKVLALAAILVVAVSAATIPDTQAESALPQVLHVGEALAQGSSPLDARSLMKRDCYYNGCRCNISSGGLACYGDNVYQCAPDGRCCVFGYRQSCHDCGQPYC
ncbi:hypothetical protein BGZ93_009481 [Podila epicladia]|nr:hypothetical protein BGZ92_005247 [Podila epicladia]KAG0090155.1 hypothetical protein BGZ93_009481 [Podila epicladia]